MKRLDPFKEEDEAMDEEPSYRLVNKEYFCYNCMKKNKGMMHPEPPYKCKECGLEFVEIIEKSHMPIAAKEKSDSKEEEKADTLDQSYNKIIFKPGENREDFSRVPA